MNVCARGPGRSVTTYGTTASARSTGSEVGVGLGVIGCSSRVAWCRPARARRDGWVERGAHVEEPGRVRRDRAFERGLVVAGDAVDGLRLDAETARHGGEVDGGEVGADVLAGVTETQHAV